MAKALSALIAEKGFDDIDPNVVKDIYAFALNNMPARYTQQGTIALRDTVRSETIEQTVADALLHILKNPKEEPVFMSTPEQAAAPCIIADVHAHTWHSHGQASVEAMYEAAKAKGLTVFGFSEHSPRPDGYAYPSDYQDKLNSYFGQYIKEVRRAAKRGEAEGVTVLLGLEADYIPGKEDYAHALCSNHPFDYIIGGLHFQGDWGFDFTADDWAPLSEEERFGAYRRYYDDMAAMCQTGLFHIAAHPDLIKLFTVASFTRWLDTDEALPAVRNALASMKDNGVIMEISSAGLRKPCKEIYPGPRIMALAAEFALPVSFASDAHCTNTPAYAFDELARYAAAFGYTHSSIVRRGKAHIVPFSAPPSAIGPPSGGAALLPARLSANTCG